MSEAVKWLTLVASACFAMFLLSRGIRELARSAARRKLDRHLGEGHKRKGMVECVSAVISRIEATSRVRAVRDAFERSGLEADWRRFRLLWLAAAMASPAFAVLLTGRLLAVLPALLLSASLPLPVLRAVRRRAERKLREQSDDLAFELSLLLKCGIPVEEATSLCAAGLSPPISLHTHALRELDRGIQGGCATLLEAAEALGHRDLELIARAAAASRQTGSDIRAVMDNIGDAVRERMAIRRELEAETVQGALSGKLVASLPFIFLGMSALVSRRTLLVLLGTPQGLLMLAVAGGLDALGFLWIRKILDFKT